MCAWGKQLLKLQFKSFTRKTTPLGNERVYPLHIRENKMHIKIWKFHLSSYWIAFGKINNIKFSVHERKSS